MWPRPLQHAQSYLRVLGTVMSQRTPQSLHAQLDSSGEPRVPMQPWESLALTGQEPLWCRLLPTAWLSGLPSGLTSSTPTPLDPRESERPLARAVLVLSPPKPVQGEPEGAPILQLSSAPWFSPTASYGAPLWAAITGLWVLAVVFAAGLGRSSSNSSSSSSSSGKASWVLSI